jgi:hypothetical protein
MPASQHFVQSEATEPFLDDTEAYALHVIHSDHGYVHSTPSSQNHRFRRFRDYLVSWASRPRRHLQLEIKPLYPNIQRVPLDLIDRYIPTPFFKTTALIIISLLWLIGFSSLIAHSVSSTHIPGFGNPRRLSCTSTPWYSIDPLIPKQVRANNHH